MSDVSSVGGAGTRGGSGRVHPANTPHCCCLPRWMSVLQNSKEEALNNAFKGDDNTGENNIVQELTKEIISEVQRMTGNDVCCDCGAPGDPGTHRAPTPALGHSDSRDAWNPPIDFFFPPLSFQT